MSGEPDIRIFEDPDAVSLAAARMIADGLESAVARRGRADWATTGGSTPVGIYRVLRVAPLRDAVPWPAVHVWWGDDRFVRRDDPLSNVRLLDELLLAPGVGVPLPPSNVHAPAMDAAIGAGDGPAAAAAAYAAELRAAGLPISGSGFPMLDVVLLGIGGDGHLLSVFPGSPLFDTPAWVSAVPAPTHIEPHIARVSLNPTLLTVARRVIVVAHGSGKAVIVASMLGPERDERRWPAQVARRDNATWLLDRAAAGSLPG